MPNLKYYEVSRPEHDAAGTTQMKLSDADVKRLKELGATVTAIGEAGAKRAATPANKVAAAPADK